MGVVLAQLVERADILMVGYRGDRAGVDNDSVCVLFDDLVPARSGKLGQRLGLKQIHLTSKGKKSELHRLLQSVYL